MRHLLGFLTILALLAGAGRSEALAQAPGMTPPGDNEVPPMAPSRSLPQGPTESVTVTVRYGWQILVADLTAVGLAAASENGEVFGAAYLLGGPIVHLANGNTATAFTSLGLRAGLPFVGMLAGAAVAEGNCDGSDDGFCGVGEILIGGVFGMGTALLVDWFVLAKKTRTEARPIFRYAGIEANPTMSATPHGATLGLAGRF